MADHPPHRRPAGVGALRRRALRAARPGTLLALLWAAACTGAAQAETPGAPPSGRDARQEGSKADFEEALQVNGGRLAGHEALQRYVAAVGARLGRFSSRPELPYEFVVVNADDVNAWALPNGKIGVHRGLLLALGNEAELASVLAHEIAHAAERHASEPLPGQTGISASAVLLGGAGRAMDAQKYSREKELDADAKGIAYMSKAGYHPQAAVSVQSVMLERQRAEQGRSARNAAWQRLLSSHPPSINRVNANRKSAAYLPGGQYREAAYRRATAPLREAAPAYRLHRSGVDALERRRADQALKYARMCVRLAAKESLCHELEGAAWTHTAQPERAGQALNRAIALNDSYFRHYLLRAKWRESMGFKAGAVLDYQRSMELLATESAKKALGRLGGLRSKE